MKEGDRGQVPMNVLFVKHYCKKAKQKRFFERSVHCSLSSSMNFVSRQNYADKAEEQANSRKLLTSRNSGDFFLPTANTRNLHYHYWC
jgi:hypothetical protein